MHARRLMFAVFVAVATGAAAAAAPPFPAGHRSQAAAVRPGEAAKPKPTPSPTRTPPHLGAQQIDAALESAETFYATLPHDNSLTDLQAVAKHIVATKAFAAATVSPGGISATLPDGSRALIVADRPEDRGFGVPPTGAPAIPGGIGPPTQHEIVFLINEADQRGAFVPSRQLAFAQAFRKLGFPQAGYQVDVADVTLDNIVALGKTHALDFFDLATHGFVGEPGPYFAVMSTTPITDVTLAQYAPDVAKGTLRYAIELAVKHKTATTTSFAFTPEFLVEHLTFNPGAIFDNQSCFGQNPLVANAVATALRGAGVGRYIGWTKAVSELDADQSEAFLLDRLLGEQSPSITGLNRYATQRTPAQRPFPLDAVETVMQHEIRPTGPDGCTKNVPYALGTCGQDDGYNHDFPPLKDGNYSRLIFSDLGGEKVAEPPLEYALPSIEYMEVAEGPTALQPSGETQEGTLTIHGFFPVKPGTVEIKNAYGTYPARVIAWTPCTSCATFGDVTIRALIPSERAGSSGLVTVRGPVAAGGTQGVASNAAPLTQWAGNAALTDDEKISVMNSWIGTGSAHVAAAFAFHIRADVHPAVVGIDTPPVPQSFTFGGLQSDSGGFVRSVSGSFTYTSKSRNAKAVFSRGPDPSFASGSCSSCSYLMSPEGWQGTATTSCNAPVSGGPQSGASNAECVDFSVAEGNALACSDNAQGYLCVTPDAMWQGADYGFLGTYPQVRPTIVLVLNPKTYTLTANVTNPPPYQRNQTGFYYSGAQFAVYGKSIVTDRLSMQFGSPISPP